MHIPKGGVGEETNRSDTARRRRAFFRNGYGRSGTHTGRGARTSRHTRNNRPATADHSAEGNAGAEAIASDPEPTAGSATVAAAVINQQGPAETPTAPAVSGLASMLAAVSTARASSSSSTPPDNPRSNLSA